MLSVGIFANHGDVGKPSTIGPGSVIYDAATGTYTVTGGGENMWGTADHFHYVWIKVSGDVALEATVEFIGSSPEPHRKACLLIRQSLDPDSPYIDAARHGDGLTSLQWREAKGDVTHEIQSNILAPTRLRIEKRGDYVSMYVDGAPAGGATKVHLTGDYYVGLAVTAHNPGRLETARFSHVSLGKPSSGSATTLINTLETISLASNDRRVAYVVVQPQRIEAPNWFPDDTRTLYFNTKGRLYKLRDGRPESVDLDPLNNINNDHGVTRDGRSWAFSDQTSNQPSQIYVKSAGATRRVTTNGPSYFHGWSPDGQTLVYCGLRNGNFDIYSIAVNGGAETRLTTNPGKDDGPEFSPDGQYIYYNSDRSGSMQIWRMRPDGSEQEQITNDDSDNWFPHISPDGTMLAFLSYERGVGDHPENKDVRLRVMHLGTRAIDELAKLFGGQGTINVNSWSPDSQSLAFVSYQIVPEQTSYQSR
jgi:dipeptidyl aminopeptidase/acylaminoacyl peptidase